MIKIGYLYYDLANLYGDSGNIKVLVERIKEQGIECEVIKLSLHEKIDFTQFDLIHIGSATENNLLLIYNDLNNYQKELKQYFDQGGYGYFSGNSLALLGTSLLINSQQYPGLKLFNYQTRELNKRLMKEIICQDGKYQNPIVGFQNQIIELDGVSNPWFSQVIQGFGNNQSQANEGVAEKNFYGSTILGPLLVRNVEVVDSLVKNLLESKITKFTYQSYPHPIDEKAYDSYRKIITK